MQFQALRVCVYCHDLCTLYNNDTAGLNYLDLNRWYNVRCELRRQHRIEAI